MVTRAFTLDAIGRQVAAHNSLAPDLLKLIVSRSQAAGGSPQDLCLLIESIVAGACVYVAASTSGGLTAEAVLDLLVGQLRGRVPDVAAAITTAGRA